MQIPPSYIKKFQRLHKNHYGIGVSSEDAQIQGVAVMKLVAITLEKEQLKQKKLVNSENEV